MRNSILVYVIMACLVLATAFALAKTEQFEPGVQAAVVGGKDAVAGRYPWFVTLYFKDPANGALVAGCGGMLIAPDVVLTAAHCGSFDSLAIGRHSLTSSAGVEMRKPLAIIGHPQFSMETLTHDIALILLDKPSTYKPVKIASPGTPIPSKLSVLGFGIDRPMDLMKISPEEYDDAIKNRPTRLQEALLDVRPCDSLTKNPGGRLICAGGKVSGCKADSGGPLFRKGRTAAEDVVFGATSFGEQCGMSKPAAWTSVPAMHDWVLTAMRELANYRDPTFRHGMAMAKIRETVDMILSMDEQFKSRCRAMLPSLYAHVNTQVIPQRHAVGSPLLQQAVALALFGKLAKMPCAKWTKLLQFLWQGFNAQAGSGQ